MCYPKAVGRPFSVTRSRRIDGVWRPRLGSLLLVWRVASMAHESRGKVLEAKYGDYGFFLGWEQDRTFGKFLKTQAGEASEIIQYYYKRHMPYKASVAFWKMRLY